MYKEQVCYRDLHDGLADCAPKAGDKVAADEIAFALNAGLPDARDKLDCHTKDVQWSSAIFVDKWDEEDAPDRETCVVDSSTGIQGVE